MPLLELRQEVRLQHRSSSSLPATLHDPAVAAKAGHSPDLDDAEGGYGSRDERNGASSTEHHGLNPSLLGKNAIGIACGSVSSGQAEVFGAAVLPTLCTEYRLSDMLQLPGSKVKQQVLKLALERVDQCDAVQNLLWGPFGFMFRAWDRAGGTSMARLELLLNKLYMQPHGIMPETGSGGHTPTPASFMTLSVFGRARRQQA